MHVKRSTSDIKIYISVLLHTDISQVFPPLIKIKRLEIQYLYLHLVTLEGFPSLVAGEPPAKLPTR